MQCEIVRYATASGDLGGSYFYHPDHLGSSSLITNGSGDLVQHIQYVPFGEVFVEERNALWSTPYKFNGKEQDEETGLCYYGARYYDPRTSVWLSVDPLAEKYPNWSSYNYCLNNPVKYVDPDGRNPGSAALIGALTEYAGIVGSKMLFNEMSFLEANASLTSKDGIDISVAAGFGALSGAFDGGITYLGKWLSSPTNRKILTKLFEVGIASLESYLKLYLKEDKIDITSILAGALAEVGIKGLLKTKSWEKDAAQASKNAEVSYQKAKDLSGRTHPNKKLIDKSKESAKSAKVESITYTTIGASTETGAKIVGNKTQELTKKKDGN